jgi:O-antigen/teichoic acid export membrane protein
MTILSKLTRHKVAKNTSVLFLAQMLSRAIGIFYIAALARYVGAEGVGMLSTATVLNGLLVLLVAPGFDTLLVRDVAADKRLASSYVSNMLFVRLALGIPFTAAVLAVAALAGYPEATVTIIRIYIVVYMLDAVTGILMPVFQAFERLEYEALGQIVRDLANISLSLVAIFLGWSLVAIAFMSIVARLIQLGLLVALLRGRFVSLKPDVNPQISWSLLTTSVPFGALLVLHTIQAQLGTFVVSLYYSAEVVGLYSAANFVIVTLLLLAGAFSKAIFPVLSSLHVHARSQLRRFYQLSFKYLVVVGFPLGMGTMLVGDRALMLIYGDDFAAAAPIIQILSIFLFTLVGYANGPLLMATGSHRFFMWTQALAAVAYAVLLMLLVPPTGSIGAAIAFVLPGMFTFFVHSVAGHRLVGLSMPWLMMGKVLLATLVMGVVVLLALQVAVPWLLVALIVAPVAYGAPLLALRVVDREELKSLASASGEASEEVSSGVQAR